MEEKAAKTTLACRVFTLVFFLVLVLPGPLWLALRGGLDTENRENRVPAAFPAWGETSLEQVPAAFEDWLADHAPFRNQWMTLNAAINWRVFGTINSDAVLRGSEGWLFYRSLGDADPLADYQGTNPYTDEQMAQIAADLDALQAALAPRGTRVALLIPPAKEPVYRRYMPLDIPLVQPHGRIELLQDYLAQHCGVPLVWPEAALRELSETQPVYYRADTHWNEAGAAYASALLLQALGLKGPAPESLEFAQAPGAAPMDLANLTATWKLVGEDSRYQALNWLPGVSVEHLAADERDTYNAYRAENAPNGGKLLMFCDSFGAAMRQPLAAGFEESVFVHINAWNESTLAGEAPDVLVLEITQRNADLLLTYLPRMVEWARQGA